MIISQLESKIEAKTKLMHNAEDQILELNKIIKAIEEQRNKTIKAIEEQRNKLLEVKSDLWWEIADIQEDVERLKEEYHIK